MTNDLKRLGYGGSATITPSGGSAVQVLVTSGSLEQANSPSYLNMLSIPRSNDSRSKVLHADGVSAYTGSLSFDVTVNALALFTTSKLFQRSHVFNVNMNDGVNYSTMTGCQVTNLTIAGSAGGLMTSSISFMSKDVKNAAVVGPTNYVLGVTGNTPLGYWWSGGTDVKDWTLAMNQAVEPVYVNKAGATPTSPKYLKTGLIDFNLDVNLYAEHLSDPSSIKIATSTFTLTGITTASGHHFNGVSDLGTYSHSFTTAPNLSTDGSDGVIIT